jgi:hypothetical protein
MALTPAETFLQTQAKIAGTLRWQFSWDMNGDGVITISDTWLLLKWLFFAPGDYLLLWFMQVVPQAAIYFEVTPASLFGLGSGVLSFFCWMIPILWISARI